MPFLLANDSIEVLVSAGQKICVTSYGAGTAKIETATGRGNYPIAFSLLTLITNSDYTSSAFTRDTTVKITAGLCDAEYVAGSNPFPTIHRITTDSNGNILLDGNSIIEVNNSTPALRITQLGAGHALLVEDEANPDSTPFVINNVGNVGIGRTPTYRLDLEASSATDVTTLVRNTNASFCSAYAAVNDLGTKFAAIGVVNSSSTLGPNYGTPGEAFIRASTSADGLVLTSVNSSGYIRFQVASAERMRIDSAGNVGIGAAPNAWAPSNKALQIVGANSSQSVSITNEGGFFLNGYYDGASYRYVGSGVSRLFSLASGHRFYSAATGTAGGNATYNQLMALDDTGNLGIGVTPSAGWHSGTKAIQVGTFGAVSCIIPTGFTELLNNCYNTTASSFAYSTSNAATRYSQQLGTHVWYSAPSGTAGAAATLNQVMTLNASGNLGIGIDPTTRLDVLGSARIRNGGLATGLILGADYNTTTTTDATIKAGQIVAPHYTNAEEPVGIIRAFVDATSSTVSIGSGSGTLNNVTVFDVYLGSSNTTTGGNVRFAIKNDGIVFTSQLAPDAVDATATLTTANLSKKIITSTTAAAVTGTLPTGTLMDGTFGTVSDLSFDWTVINTGPNSFTLAAGTGHTIVGNATVATNTSGTFKSRRTGAATWISYRI